MKDFNFVLELIEKEQEYKYVDFKKTLDWEDKEHKFKLIKNILAFSNIKGGGVFPNWL